MKLLKIRQSVFSFFQNIIPRFLNNNFEITSTKRSKITGVVICVVTLIAIILNVNTYISQEFASKWLLLAFSLAAPFILGLSAAYNIRIKNDKVNKIWHFVFMLLLPFITITMTECLNNVFIYNMTYLSRGQRRERRSN